MADVQQPWLRCTCASIPPTMPTCRTEHLRSCPMYVYVAVAKMEADESRAASTFSPPGKVKVEVSLITGGVHGAAAMTARAIRTLMEESASAALHDQRNRRGPLTGP